MSDVWIIQHDCVNEEKGKYCWDAKTYKRVFGNVLFVTFDRNEVIMKAIEMYLDHQMNLVPASKERKKKDTDDDSFEIASMKLSPNVLIEGPDDLLRYNDGALYDMMKCCTHIGERATSLKSKLKDVLHHWNSESEFDSGKHWLNISTFAQRVAVEHHTEMQKIIDSI